MMEEEEETLFDQEGLLGDRSSGRSEQSERRRKLFKTAALTLAFFALGCCIAIPGATLLDLGERVGKDTEHMTFIATARSAGYLIGAIFGGIMSDFFDHQLLLFYVMTLTSAATAVIPWCTVLYSLTGMIGVQGIALGVLDTGGNIFCIRIWGKKSPPYMQFLHFAFAIGAFLAPLIAHPFLLNTILEFSSNNSDSSNASLKAVLPYATTVHFADGRTKRDVALNDINSLHLNEREHLHSSSKYRRDVVPPIGNVTDSLNKTGLVDTPLAGNNSSAEFTTFAYLAESTTFRPKKPEVVHPLSKAHADSGLVVDRLKDLKKNPPTGVEEESKEAVVKDEEVVAIHNGSGSEPVGTMDNATLKANASDAQSSDGGAGGKDEQPIPKTMPTSSSTSSTTTTTSTTTTSSTTTSTTTTTTPATTPPPTSTTTTAAKIEVEAIPNINFPPNISSDNNVSVSHNDTALNKPNTWSDLVYSMLDTMRHMSKIQFAYLIIGLFLITNAGLFLGLYCQDKVGGFKLSEVSHVDLTRPPDSSCFVGALLTLLFVFFLFYVGMEQTYGILLTTFAVEYPGTIRTPAQGATVTAAFWGCVAFGRGLSICISRFFKAPCMLVSNLILTLLGAVLLSFALKASWVVLWVGTVLLGLGMSSLFPTTFSWANSYYPLTGRASAVFVAGSGVGQMTIPVLTGYLYQNVDRMSLMYVMCALSVLLCVIYTCLQVLASKKGNSSGVSRSHSGFIRLHTSEDVADSLDMDLIQAGSMDRPVMHRDRTVIHRNREESTPKQNGVSREFEVTEFSKLVELSD